MPNLRHSGSSEFLEGLALGFYTTWGLFLGLLVYLYCYHNEWFQYNILWKQAPPIRKPVTVITNVKQIDKYYV